MSEETYRRRTRRKPPAPSAGHDRWMVSYADLLTLLFALFVILYAAADHERARIVAAAIALQFGETPAVAPALPGGARGVLSHDESFAQARAAIEQIFANDNALAARARFAVTERGIVVSLAEAGFFAPGEAAIREDARPLIEGLAEALRAANLPLRVEGHTDSTPIATARYPSNWELSAARASAVLARLVERGLPPARLSVAGYADERPAAGNDTPQGRALNRRVDLVVLRKEE